MPAGSLVGALAVTSLADRIGRKNTIILASIIWIIGGVLQCAAIVRAFSYRYPAEWNLLTSSFSESWYAGSGSCHRWDFRRSLVHCSPHLSIRDHCSLDPWSACVDAAMVDHLGYHATILCPIRLLVHQRYCVLPHSVGSPNYTCNTAWYRDVMVPGISPLAHRSQSVGSLQFPGLHTLYS